jgi:hypothetical protein
LGGRGRGGRRGECAPTRVAGPEGGRWMRRVCIGTSSQAREEDDAASVYGFTGTL